jgi:chromosome segregation ATPase
MELQEQIDSGKLQIEKLMKLIQVSEQTELALKKEISSLKYDNKRMSMDLKDAKERFDKVKNEYQT